jgi:hypothetical protein
MYKSKLSRGMSIKHKLMIDNLDSYGANTVFFKLLVSEYDKCYVDEIVRFGDSIQSTYKSLITMTIKQNIAIIQNFIAPDMDRLLLKFLI